MGEQWVDPRRLPPPSSKEKPGRRRSGARSPIGRPSARGSFSGPGNGGLDEDGEEVLGPPRKDKTALYVAAAGGGAVLLFILVAVAMSGGSTRPGRTRRYPKRSPVVRPQSAVKRTVVNRYKPPEGISPNDCGSIRGICTACEYETDISRCKTEGCGARNFFFQDKNTNRFICFRCGKEAPPVRCEKCGGPLFRPKIKAR